MDRSFYQKMVDGAQGLEEQLNDPTTTAAEKVAVIQGVQPVVTSSALLSIAFDLHRIANHLDSRTE